MEEKGAWVELLGGGAALRLSIRSPDAGSHIVVFRSGTAVLALGSTRVAPLMALCQGFHRGALWEY